MFSNTAKYAIKACLFLAVNSAEEKKLMVKDIAESINVPQAYMAKILQALSRKDLISSTRGPRGGFYLTEINKNSSVTDIIHAVDGEDRINSCLLSLNKCNAENPCSLHHLAYDKKQDLLANLKGASLESLAEHIKQGKSVLPL